MQSEEFRFINNLSVLVECGRPLVDALSNMRKDCRVEELVPAYDSMIAKASNGGDFTSVLTDYPQLCSRSSLALLRAARRASCLAVVLPKLATLVRAKVEGTLDPRQRFFEIWALLGESGFAIDEALVELRHEFKHGPLKEVADGLSAAMSNGKCLADGAEQFPEVFNAVSCDLLRYGESRDLTRALHAITRLV